ncbi:MAG: glycosyltransferase family 4 protein [Planctomycetes bacterium]|nr:glycosyltransferase family 4 protein [Planctomycetota bacterium]
MLLVEHRNGLDGASRSLLALLDHLDRRAVDPQLACPARNPLLELAMARGLRVHPVDIPSRGPLHRSQELWEAGCRLERVIRHSGARIVHAHGAAAGFATLLALRRSRAVPLIWHAREVEQHLEARRAARRATVIVASYRAVATALRSEVGVELIADGVADEFFAPPVDARTRVRAELGVPADVPLVGVIARLEPSKGHDAVCDAIPRIASRHPACHFAFGGPPVGREAFEEFAADVRACARGDLASRLVFIPPRDDIPAVLAALDVLVHPAVGAESTARVVVEAKAVGRPTVASAVGVLPELVRDATDGFLVPPGDSAALTDRILRLLDDAALRAEFGRAARRDAHERFTAARQARAMEALYLRAVAPRAVAE